jgi:small subunit ribosomal protein S9
MATEKYTEGVGRRKTAVARARLTPASSNSIIVNDKPLNEYFKVLDLQNTAMASLTEAKEAGKFKVTVKTNGGGVASQAEAIRHASARALIKDDVNLRKELKKAGFLKRDSRAKERRKFGLKKARKAPQWSKR